MGRVTHSQLRLEIDRVTTDDLMALVGAGTTHPMQAGAVLFLDAADDFDLTEAVEMFGARVAQVPRLHQLLVDLPLGHGRPIWVEDADFVLGDQMAKIVCPTPANEEAVLGIAARVVNTPLPRSRPLWSATLVTAASSGAKVRVVALVVVFHHVMADGIGGLAVLAGLADGGAPPGESPKAVPLDAIPSRTALFLDAWRERIASIRRIRGEIRKSLNGVAALRSAASIRSVHGSLNVPTRDARLLEAVSVGLGDLRTSSHAAGATVNDAVLAAIAGSLRRLMELRGESLNDVVISVPFSTRRATVGSELGNHSGVTPLVIPTGGDRTDRLAAVGAITLAAKRAPRAASTAVLGPLFRGLDRVGAYRWFIDRQRMINTVVSSVHGPEKAISVLGCTVTRIVPLGVPTGNLPVTFVALTYSSVLTVTIVSDPDACPDVRMLRAILIDELRAFASLRQT